MASEEKDTEQAQAAPPSDPLESIGNLAAPPGVCGTGDPLVAQDDLPRDSVREATGRVQVQSKGLMTAAVEAHPYLDLLSQSEEAARPLVAHLELTHACNEDCEHCYLDLLPDKKIGALDTSEWKRIFDELAEEGCLFLTFSGGEVLVRRDWEELARYARSLGFALRLFTNASLVTEQVADRIAAVKPMQIDVSLLGGTAATHDAITRRRGSFEKTLRGGEAASRPRAARLAQVRRDEEEHRGAPAHPRDR